MGRRQPCEDLSDFLRAIKLANRKVGQVHTWSLPAGASCPGRTPVCEHYCYARRALARNQAAFQKRWELSLRPDFVPGMIEAIRKLRCRYFRVHVSGDFYSPEYVLDWVEIARGCRSTKFWAYTRSWRLPAFSEALAELASVRNFSLWYSCDRDSRELPKVPPRVRWAYMAEDDQDLPPEGCHLVFRVRRKTVQKRQGGVLVCPAENGVTSLECSTCRLCIEPKEEQSASRRIALKLI